MTSEDISLAANVATVIALVLTFIALFLTAYQLWVGRRASSAAALIGLNESLRQSWLGFKSAPEGSDKQYAFADLVNLFEIACATRADSLFVGASGKIVERYVIDILQAIDDSPESKARIEAMLGGHPGTFENILAFIEEHRREIRIGVPKN